MKACLMGKIILGQVSGTGAKESSRANKSLVSVPRVSRALHPFFLAVSTACDHATQVVGCGYKKGIMKTKQCPIPIGAQPTRQIMT